MEMADIIKNHFEQEAREFDEIILKLIPFYREMVDAMVAAVPYPDTAAIRVMDLGCGTGTVAKRVKEMFPKARVTCLDISENMIEMAKIKLKNCSDITYVAGNFEKYGFEGEYDVVVSSLALHHIQDDEGKKRFYSRIYHMLSTGGVFYNADVVLGANSFLQEMYIEKWKNFMQTNVPKYEVEGKWLVKYQEEDRPARLTDQMEWLNNIGFKDVDVVWKYYNYAVYGGQK